MIEIDIFLYREESFRALFFLEDGVPGAESFRKEVIKARPHKNIDFSITLAFTTCLCNATTYFFRIGLS